MNEHLPEPLIYSAWLRAIQTRLIRDELGPLAEEFTHVEPLFIERVYRDIEGASVWCDVIQSAPVETCDQIASAPWMMRWSGSVIISTVIPTRCVGGMRIRQRMTTRFWVKSRAALFRQYSPIHIRGR